MKSDGHAETEVSRATDPLPPEGLAPPGIVIEYGGACHRICFSVDLFWSEETRLLVDRLVGSTVGLYREDSRAAGLRAKGSAPTQDMIWRREVHASEIAIARRRLQELGALSEERVPPGNAPTV